MKNKIIILTFLFMSCIVFLPPQAQASPAGSPLFAAANKAVQIRISIGGRRHYYHRYYRPRRVYYGYYRPGPRYVREVFYVYGRPRVRWVRAY